MSIAYWLHEYFNDALFFTCSALILLAYSLYLRIRLRKDPSYTVHAVMCATRRAWVTEILADPARTIVGVQTLRNSTMAATFLASTSVLLIMGTLTLSGQADNLKDSWHQINTLGSSHPDLWVFKVLMLLTSFILAFFNFAMAVRLFHHVGYLLGVSAESRPAEVTAGAISRHLNRAGRYYALGMRFYFFAVPLVFWLFGPHLMLVASVVLVLVLYHVDRSPQHRNN